MKLEDPKESDIFINIHILFLSTGSDKDGQAKEWVYKSDNTGRVSLKQN